MKPLLQVTLNKKPTLVVTPKKLPILRVTPNTVVNPQNMDIRSMASKGKALNNAKLS